jgi:hypothetical protein
MVTANSLIANTAQIYRHHSSRYEPQNLHRLNNQASPFLNIIKHLQHQSSVVDQISREVIVE